MKRAYHRSDFSNDDMVRRTPVAKYKAVMMHGNRDAEGVHPFEAADDLLSHSPVTVMRAFMTAMDSSAGVGHIDYELNAAMKSKKGDIVTALGHLVFHGDNEQPFICMISRNGD